MSLLNRLTTIATIVGILIIPISAASASPLNPPHPKVSFPSPLLVAQSLPDLPVRPSAEAKLINVQTRMGWSRAELFDRAVSQGQWFIDRDNQDNINIFIPRPDYELVPGYVRITLDPDRIAIISAGFNRYRDVQGGILRRRFIPTFQN